MALSKVKETTWKRMKDIVPTLTPERLVQAAEEYKMERFISDPDIAFFVQEMKSFGYNKPMSNEERLDLRQRMMSLDIAAGMKSICITINPNDQTNPVVFPFIASRLSVNATEAAQIRKDLMDEIRRYYWVTADPVSSAMFFDRTMKMVIQHYFRLGQQSVLGKLSHYIGGVETNDKGTLHWHGVLYFDANVYMRNMITNIAGEGMELEQEKVINFVDDVFHEVSKLL